MSDIRKVLEAAELRNIIEQYANAKADFALHPTHASAKAYFDIAASQLNDALAQPQAAQPAPSGYAYRYSDGIRFNGGQEVNGSKPTEAIPYWFATPPTEPAPQEKP